MKKQIITKTTLESDLYCQHASIRHLGLMLIAFGGISFMLTVAQLFYNADFVFVVSTFVLAMCFYFYAAYLFLYLSIKHPYHNCELDILEDTVKEPCWITDKDACGHFALRFEGLEKAYNGYPILYSRNKPVKSGDKFFLVKYTSKPEILLIYPANEYYLGQDALELLTEYNDILIPEKIF